MSEEELEDYDIYLYTTIDDEYGDVYRRLEFYNSNYESIEESTEDRIKIGNRYNKNELLRDSYNMGIGVFAPLPNSVLQDIIDCDTATIYAMPDSCKRKAYKAIPKDVDDGEAIEVFELETRNREGDYPIFDNTSHSHFITDINECKSLEPYQLAYMTLDMYRRCADASVLPDDCRICIQLNDYRELSTDEAISLQGKVEFVRLRPNVDGRGLEAEQVYYLDEYIEVSNQLDRIIETIDPNASFLEKMAGIYYGVGTTGSYDYDEYEKMMRCKECGNVYGALVKRLSTCAGFSESILALAQRLGYKARVFSGCDEDFNNGHAICEVYNPEIDKWIQLDVTLDLDGVKRGNWRELIGFGQRYYDFFRPDFEKRPIEDFYFPSDEERVEAFEGYLEKITPHEIEETSIDSQDDARPISLPYLRDEIRDEKIEPDFLEGEDVPIKDYDEREDFDYR